MTFVGSCAPESRAALWGIGPMGAGLTMRIGVVLESGLGRSGTSVARTAVKLRSAMFRSWFGTSSFGSASRLGAALATSLRVGAMNLRAGGRGRFCVFASQITTVGTRMSCRAAMSGGSSSCTSVCSTRLPAPAAAAQTSGVQHGRFWVPARHQPWQSWAAQGPLLVPAWLVHVPPPNSSLQPANGAAEAEPAAASNGPNSSAARVSQGVPFLDRIKTAWRRLPPHGPSRSSQTKPISGAETVEIPRSAVAQ